MLFLLLGQDHSFCAGAFALLHAVGALTGGATQRMPGRVQCELSEPVLLHAKASLG